MNIITIMNYDFKNKLFLAMCLTWLKQANEWLDDSDSVTIYSTSKIEQNIQKYAKTLNLNIKWITYTYSQLESDILKKVCYFNGPNVAQFECYDKLFLFDKINEPCLFIDADAFITGPLNIFKNIILEDNRPLVMIDHERDIDGHTNKFPAFPNSGVMLINDPNKTFISTEKIAKYGETICYRYFFPGSYTVIPGNDQALLYSYCLENDYDYNHPLINNNYNSWAGRTEYYLDRNNKWSAKNKITDERIFISHHWWRFKPWDSDYKIPCPFFDEILERLNNA